MFAACAGLAVIWCVILPALTQWDVIRNHVEFLESRRIDASAMYYTELDPRSLIGAGRRSDCPNNVVEGREEQSQ